MSHQLYWIKFTAVYSSSSKFPWYQIYFLSTVMSIFLQTSLTVFRSLFIVHDWHPYNTLYNNSYATKSTRKSLSGFTNISLNGKLFIPVCDSFLFKYARVDFQVLLKTFSIWTSTFSIFFRIQLVFLLRKSFTDNRAILTWFDIFLVLIYFHNKIQQQSWISP